MIQNHLLQILSLIAMEPPAAFTADEIRARKVDVLRAIRPIPVDHLHQYAVTRPIWSRLVGGRTRGGLPQ